MFLFKSKAKKSYIQNEVHYDEYDDTMYRRLNESGNVSEIRQIFSKAIIHSKKLSTTSDLGFNSRILRRAKFSSQKGEPKSQLVSNGSPHVFHRGLDSNTVRKEATFGTESPTGYVDKSCKASEKNERHSENEYSSKILRSNTRENSSSIAYSNNNYNCDRSGRSPLPKPRRDYHLNTHTNSSSFAYPNKNYNFDRSKSCPSPNLKRNHLPINEVLLSERPFHHGRKSVDPTIHNNTLHRDPCKNNSFLLHRDESNNPLLSCSPQYRSRINHKQSSLIGCKSLEMTLQNNNNKPREKHLLIGRKPITIGIEKSNAIMLINERKYEQSYYMFLNVLQKEKKLSYLNPSYRISLEIAESNFYIGILLELRGQLECSLLYLNKALIIRQQNLEKNHLDIAWNLYYLGMIKGKIGNFEAAIFDLEDCSSIQKNNRLEHMNTQTLLKNYRLLQQKAVAA